MESLSQSFSLSEVSVGPFVGNLYLSTPLWPSLPLFLSLDSYLGFLGNI